MVLPAVSVTVKRPLILVEVVFPNQAYMMVGHTVGLVCYALLLVMLLCEF